MGTIPTRAAVRHTDISLFVNITACKTTSQDLSTTNDPQV